jgi:hypothetical protein
MKAEDAALLNRLRALIADIGDTSLSVLGPCVAQGRMPTEPLHNLAGRLTAAAADLRDHAD